MIKDLKILYQFTTLRRISIIMPDAELMRALPPWTLTTRHTLRGLSLICEARSHQIK
jgi:hypothetical protein